MENIDKITDFIDNSPQRSIFCYPWWLNAVSPDRFDYVTIKKTQQIKALLPIVTKNKLCFKLCTMPPYTQTLGPLLPKLQGKYVTRLSKEHKYMKKLINRLPKCSYYNFRFHYSITNWLPFHWQKFKQKTRYTYILENIKDHENIWQEMRSNIRRAIRKSEDIVQVEECNDINILIDLHKMTFERKNKSIPEKKIKTINRIYEACSKRNQCKLLIAKDKDGQYHSSQLFVWDDRMAYYLIGGNHPDLMSSGASSLVMWKGIKYTSQKVNNFNFEGSMIYGVERFFRGFGGRQKRYFQIKKYRSKVLQIYDLL